LRPWSFLVIAEGQSELNALDAQQIAFPFARFSFVLFSLFLLGIFGIGALLESERLPGVFLLVLAGAWTLAAPSWRHVVIVWEVDGRLYDPESTGGFLPNAGAR
jgi:hypothetical protein